jgi:hypothetical protein
MEHDIAERTDIPMQAEGQLKAYQECNTKLAEPTLRDRLESKRNRLTRQLVQVEEALRLIYADPNAEKIFETLNRARP